MNRRALLAGFAAALLVLAAWYFLLWKPRNNALAEARARREQAEVQRAELQTRLARLRALQRNEPRLRAQLETLRTAIPDQPNLAQFILDANDAAVRSGIDFMSIAPTPPAVAGATPGATPGTTPTTAPAGGAPAGGAPGVGAGAAAQIGLTLQISGGYFQVLDFLNRLDELPRLVVTDGLNVTSNQQARLTVNVTARMFTRSIPPGFGGSAPAGATTTTAPAAGGGATTTTTTGARP